MVTDFERVLVYDRLTQAKEYFDFGKIPDKLSLFYTLTGKKQPVAFAENAADLKAASKLGELYHALEKDNVLVQELIATKNMDGKNTAADEKNINPADFAANTNENPSTPPATATDAKNINLNSPSEKLKGDNPKEILINQKNAPDKSHDLNIFLSRLLFCFFAEDTALSKKNIFTDTLLQGLDLAKDIARIFKRLGSCEEASRPLANFPYVNGELFYLEQIFARKKDSGGKNDGRVHVIFEGGTHSQMTLQSLRKYIDMNDGSKMLSQPQDAGSTQEQQARIQLWNKGVWAFNSTKALHGFFAAARCESCGKHGATECFSLPLGVIKEAINLLMKNELKFSFYDAKMQGLQRVG